MRLILLQQFYVHTGRQYQLGLYGYNCSRSTAGSENDSLIWAISVKTVLAGEPAAGTDTTRRTGTIRLPNLQSISDIVNNGRNPQFTCNIEGKRFLVQIFLRLALLLLRQPLLTQLSCFSFII